MGKKLITKAKIDYNHSILDVGCGTGELTYLLAEKVMPNGEVSGIDPDTDRLKIAQANQPKMLKNIKWHNISIENFNGIANEFIDIIYSNYAMHWVSDKNQALAHIYKFLKPNGQFVMNCIVQPSQIISDLENTQENPLLTTRKYPLTDKNTWLLLLEKHNFKILSTNAGDNCIFKNLDEFLIFWEATSHGKFSCETLANKRYQYLLKKYPGEIAVFGKETLSLLAIK